jgi:hypothetical protein
VNTFVLNLARYTSVKCVCDYNEMLMISTCMNEKCLSIHRGRSKVWLFTRWIITVYL